MILYHSLGLNKLWALNSTCEKRLTHMLSQSSKNDQKKDIRPIKIIRHKQNT